MTKEVSRYFFLLSVLLIIAVYFVGVSTDARVFGGVVQQLVYAGTGRDSSGKFAQYPTSPSSTQIGG